MQQWQNQATLQIYLLQTQNIDDYALFVPSGVISETPHIVLIRSLTEEQLDNILTYIIPGWESRIQSTFFMSQLIIKNLIRNNKTIQYNEESIEDIIELIREGQLSQQPIFGVLSQQQQTYGQIHRIQNQQPIFGVLSQQQTYGRIPRIQQEPVQSRQTISGRVS